MKKLILTLLFTFAILQPSAQAEMDPRAKALGTMALYGTIGGALLGTAALAFDAPGRSVAVGASLGLYTGLIFGGYVVGSHYMKKKKYSQPQDGYYPDTQDSPYEGGGGYNDEGGTTYPVEEPQGFYQEEGPRFEKKESYQKPGPVYYVQFLNMKF